MTETVTMAAAPADIRRSLSLASAPNRARVPPPKNRPRGTSSGGQGGEGTRPPPRRTTYIHIRRRLPAEVQYVADIVHAPPLESKVGTTAFRQLHMKIAAHMVHSTPHRPRRHTPPPPQASRSLALLHRSKWCTPCPGRRADTPKEGRTRGTTHHYFRHTTSTRAGGRNFAAPSTSGTDTESIPTRRSRATATTSTQSPAIDGPLGRRLPVNRYQGEGGSF